MFSLNGGIPNLHSCLVGKPMGLLGKPTILGKPPYLVHQPKTTSPPPKSFTNQQRQWQGSLVEDCLGFSLTSNRDRWSKWVILKVMDPDNGNAESLGHSWGPAIFKKNCPFTWKFFWGWKKHSPKFTKRVVALLKWPLLQKVGETARNTAIE